MAAFNKFRSFVEALAEKKHNLGSDSLKVALTNSAPSVDNTILTDIAEVSYTNCSSRALTVSSSAQALGIYSLAINDLVLTASGGSVGPFRYIVIYNDTAASDELVCFFDYGAAITLGDGETLTLDFPATILTLQ